AKITYEVVRTLETQPRRVPGTQQLTRPDIRAAIVEAVKQQLPPAQATLAGFAEQPDVDKVVDTALDIMVEGTISIPRILVVPTGDVRAGFHPFSLDLSNLRYPPVSDELWVQHLRTGQRDIVALGSGGVEEQRPEDYVVSGLIDFDDISYDDHAELLYDLAAQTVEHFRGYLSEADTTKVLRAYQREIARNIHAQMQAHYWESATSYDTVVSKGFINLKESAYTYAINEQPLDYHVSPADKSNMAKYLFSGFRKCLYAVQKFDSDAERKLAVILERDSIKWFKPARGQFQMVYLLNGNQQEYQP
ncbi:type III restriction endonuclease subunit R, partial [Kouleothrix aurantiaca]